MIGIMAMIELPRFPNDNPKSDPPELRGGIETPKSDDWVMLILLMAIALTSKVWTSFQFLLQAHLDIIIALAVAAAIAKVFGGILAERWGWRRWTVGSLTVATLLLLFGTENRLTLLLGLALLQSSIPITLAATAQMMPQKPATAAGFALGLAIIIGGIPVVGGLSAIAGISKLIALISITAIPPRPTLCEW